MLGRGNMAISMFYLAFFFVSLPTVFCKASLRVGYYRKTCPAAEFIVRGAVNRATVQNPGLGAGLIRMHFHDCFVRGCDASVLLDSTPGNPTEKEHPSNGPTLRGFEIIDDAKAELERHCPGVVSCADIIAFAARDAVAALGRFHYYVPGGRRDGRVSHIDDPTTNLPQPIFNIDQLEKLFAQKGLSLEDMVALSGAHSIGVTHCSVLTNMLHSLNGTHKEALQTVSDMKFAGEMRSKCSKLEVDKNGRKNDMEVPLDFLSPHKLDNDYYRNLQNKRGLLASDQALMNNPLTARWVSTFARYGRVWGPRFGDAMVKMGKIDVLTGHRSGEIRRNCRVVN